MYRPRIIVRHHPHAVSLQDIGEAVLVVGVLAGIGYGAYKLCNWLFSKTDEQIARESSDTLTQAHVRFDSLLSFFERSLGAIPQSPHAQTVLMHNANEVFLYDYATILLQTKTYAETIISDINYTVSSLKSLENTVVNRLDNLQRYDSSANIFIQLQAISEELYKYRTTLEFIRNYLDCHRTYFSLFEREAQCMSYYDFELKAMDEHAGNSVYLKEVLRVSIMRHANKNNSFYPYMDYINKLQSDYCALERAIHGIAHSYNNRITVAQTLFHKMNFIYNLLLIDDAYRQELRDYERAQIEKQRLEAEKAKATAATAHAMAAQAQAAAMQQQVWELQKQNTLHAQQIQATHDQNALIAAQTIVNAINPPQEEIHIYV